jgi:hypothetical protein
LYSLLLVTRKKKLQLPLKAQLLSKLLQPLMLLQLQKLLLLKLLLLKALLLLNKLQLLSNLLKIKSEKGLEKSRPFFLGFKLFPARK